MYEKDTNGETKLLLVFQETDWPSKDFYQSRLTVRSGKKSSNQETGVGNKGRQKVLNNNQIGPK